MSGINILNILYPDPIIAARFNINYLILTVILIVIILLIIVIEVDARLKVLQL